MLIETVGIFSTLLILVSMCFKTTSFKGSLIMRILNLLGSIVFMVYGILLPAISTAVLNAALIMVNGYHLLILIKENKKQEENIKKEEV
jgi:CHASE2 domain-containing sensor protein